MTYSGYQPSYTAVAQAHCDPSIASQWKTCSTKDVAIHGGSLQVPLPASGSLRATKLILVNSDKHPLTVRPGHPASRRSGPGIDLVTGLQHTLICQRW